MDKQMIEGMAMKLFIAQDLCRRIKDCDGCKYNDVVDSKLCENLLMAEELLKYYQPKIPENAVVLTREEYERLCDLAYFGNGEETVRKETAEKFADKLRCEYIDFDDTDEVWVGGLREDISKICKEITKK